MKKRMIMMLDDQNKWIEATPEDQIEIAKSNETTKFLAFDIKTFNKTVGFIGYANDKSLIFKTKDISNPRNSGSICSQAGKAKNLLKLNEIIGEDKYTKETTKNISDTELCVMMEFILRYFNESKKDGKRWFLSPELAIYHKFYSV